MTSGLRFPILAAVMIVADRRLRPMSAPMDPFCADIDREKTLKRSGD